MTRLLVYIAILFVWSKISIAQSFSPENTRSTLDSISSETDRIDFVIDNFYKIYSADLDNAILLTSQASEMAEKLELKDEQGFATMFNGVAYYLRGDYEKALASYQKASKLFDAVENYDGMARLNNEMAVFYHKQKDLDKAYACLDNAEHAALKANNQEELGTSYAHRGAFLSVRGKVEEAHPYFLKTLEIRKALNDSIGLGYVYLDLANYELHNKNLKGSLDWINRSTEIRKQIGDEQGVAVNTVILGENYFEVGQYRQAISYFEKTIELATPIGMTDLIKFCFSMLQKSYKELGEYKAAYEALQQERHFSDSLLNVSKTKAIAEMETQFETEKKDNEIAFLNQENELKTASLQRNTLLLTSLAILLGLVIVLFYFLRYRSQQKHQAVLQEQKVRMRESQMQAVIDSQESERKRFATDLHDGMGQLISALQLNIQAMNESKGDLEKRDQLYENSTGLLKDVHKEIRNIAFNLMPQTLTKEGLVAAVKELIKRINKTKQLTVHFSEMDMEARLPEVAEVSLYRIIQELLSNIMKYSKASNVYLGLTNHGDEVVLTLEDDGEGYDLDKFKVSEGNGWRNINTRLNLIKAEIEIDTRVGRKGTSTIINVPMAVTKEFSNN